MDQQGEILGLFPNVLARKVWNEGSKFNSGMKDLFYRIEKDFPMDNTFQVSSSTQIENDQKYTFFTSNLWEYAGTL